MEQFKKFVKKINRKIKDSDNYKEKEILDKVKQKIQSCCNSGGNDDFCEELKRSEMLFSNFIQGDYKVIEEAVKNKAWKRLEISYCRSIFGTLKIKYGDIKYYDILGILPSIQSHVFFPRDSYKK